MASVSVRGLDESVLEGLRLRAAEQGRSVEAEIRAILTDAVGPRASEGLAQVLLTRFGALGGVDLHLPPRTDAPRAPDVPGWEPARVRRDVRGVRPL